MTKDVLYLLAIVVFIALIGRGQILNQALSDEAAQTTAQVDSLTALAEAERQEHQRALDSIAAERMRVDTIIEVQRVVVRDERRRAQSVGAQVDEAFDSLRVSVAPPVAPMVDETERLVQEERQAHLAALEALGAVEAGLVVQLAGADEALARTVQQRDRGLELIAAHVRRGEALEAERDQYRGAYRSERVRRIATEVGATVIIVVGLVRFVL